MYFEMFENGRYNTHVVKVWDLGVLLSVSGGFKRARCCFIHFFDIDDKSLPNYYQEMMPCVALYSLITTVDRDHRIYRDQWV